MIKKTLLKIEIIEKIVSKINEIKKSADEIKKSENEIKKSADEIIKAKNEIKDTLDKYSPYPINYPWIMSKEERTLFDKTIANSKYYLEFGSGGSTIRALQKSDATIYSVDSSQEWIDFMEEYFVVRVNKESRLTFHTVDIGKTKEWGNPVDDSSKHLFPNYSSEVFTSIDATQIDTVFIDGRFRVACVLRTILNVFSTKSNDTIILIHDFWNREQYHSVLDYLEVIDKVDTLGVFKIKDNIDLEEVQKEYDKYKFIYN